MSGSEFETQAKTYDLDIIIEAPRSRVWQAIVEETNAWWLPDFHMLGQRSSVTFKARAGGQLIESAADGSSLLWYTVHMCVPEESLYLVGHLAPDFGGPATTMLRLKLTEKRGVTHLSVQDSLVGRFDKSTSDSLELGWAQLFGEGLKRYAERV